VYNEEYTRKVLPYLKPEYFNDPLEKELFVIIHTYINKYNALPSKEALLIDMEGASLNDEQRNDLEVQIEKLSVDNKTSLDWLLDTTEQFCKRQSIKLALMMAIKIVQGDEKLTEDAIPKILSDAISVSFDNSIGHDYFDNAEQRYEYYHMPEFKIPFSVDILNKITRGGVSRKTLTILMAGINVGKTLNMCAFASDNLKDGKNVLYITMEMSEEEITQRVDANLINISMDDVLKLEKNVFLSRVNAIKKNTIGRLKVKQYPTSKGSVGNFEVLLNELKMKQNFVPDIIYVDYLNICSSARMSKGKASLYEYVGAIGEELRGLAVEKNVAIITATQFNRTGFKSSDPGLDDVSESFGTGAIADLVLSLVRSEELDKLNQIMFTQLKSRYADKGENRKFVVGVDINKMKIYDVENRGQNLAKDPDIDTDTFDLMFNDEIDNTMFKDFQ
jgi:archaellum biogenesis ATPase FlaH